METLTELQEVLITLLANSKVSKDNAIGIMIALKNHEDIMKEMVLWIHKNKPTEQEIMKMLLSKVEKYI